METTKTLFGLLGGGFPPGIVMADLDRLTAQRCIHCRSEVDWWHKREDAHCTVCWDRETIGRCGLRREFEADGLHKRAEGVKS